MIILPCIICGAPVSAVGALCPAHDGLAVLWCAVRAGGSPKRLTDWPESVVAHDVLMTQALFRVAFEGETPPGWRGQVLAILRAKRGDE